MILYQVNKYLSKRRYLKDFLRCVHNIKDPPRKCLYPLESRKLLKVSGSDASIFLQGLITNDMRHFEEGSKSVYAMFLNNKGRVLFDTLIHKWEEYSFLLECDHKIVNVLEKHLKVFKLRRKVQIEDVNNQYKIWAIVTSSDLTLNEKIDSKCEINIFKDPRLTDLGYRLISVTHMSGPQILSGLDNDIVVESNEEGYRYLRYKLGVSEGADDLPPGTSFPLEVNCDYLHGVSFHKGCYIGQELTARVHHTGVVRKRIMPIKFTGSVNENIQKDSIITAHNNPKLNLGKVKGVLKNYGIGLIRTKEALESNSLCIGKYVAEAVKPYWWPIEAPKEIIKSE